MTHTPTPWEWDAGDIGQDYSVPYCQISVDGGNIIIADVNDRFEGRRANIARIVAAVNFFHGQPIPTERIPEGGFWEMAEALYNSNRLLGTLATLDDEVTIAAMKINRQLLAKLGVEP